MVLVDVAAVVDEEVVVDSCACPAAAVVVEVEVDEDAVDVVIEVVVVATGPPARWVRSSLEAPAAATQTANEAMARSTGPNRCSFGLAAAQNPSGSGQAKTQASAWAHRGQVRKRNQRDISSE